MKKYNWLSWISAAVLVIGIQSCAGTSQFLQKSQVALPIIDTFYQQVLDKKSNPALLTAATIILQQADAIVKEVQKQGDTPELISKANVLYEQARNLGVK